MAKVIKAIECWFCYRAAGRRRLQTRCMRRRKKREEEKEEEKEEDEDEEEAVVELARYRRKLRRQLSPSLD